MPSYQSETVCVHRSGMPLQVSGLRRPPKFATGSAIDTKQQLCATHALSSPEDCHQEPQKLGCVPTHVPDRSKLLSWSQSWILLASAMTFHCLQWTVCILFARKQPAVDQKTGASVRHVNKNVWPAICCGNPQLCISSSFQVTFFVRLLDSDANHRPKQSCLAGGLQTSKRSSFTPV